MKSRNSRRSKGGNVANEVASEGLGDDLISIRRCAREAGVSHTILQKQIASGAIRSHNGKVRLSEVLEDRANNIRQKVGSSPDAPVEVDGQFVTLADAQRRIAVATAQLKELELDVRGGKLVDAAGVERDIERLSRSDRDAFLNWPSRVSAEIAARFGINSVELEIELERRIKQFLIERGDPRIHLG